MRCRITCSLRFLSGCLALFLGVGFLVPSALATSLDTKSYRFIPRLSTLHQTGGFAGFDTEFTVMGTYDFVVEPAATQTSARQARFTNVDAWASHPFLAYVLLLDDTLNLSRLAGRQVLSDFPGLSLFEFRGEDHQGAPLALHVATLNRWMYVRGQNDAPCCDFFDYTLRAVARQTPSADFDNDGAVGYLDLQVWEENFGAGEGSTSALSTIEGSDFLRWQREVGDEAPSLEAFDALVTSALAAAYDSHSAAAHVPEPAGMLLLVMDVLVTCIGRVKL